MLFLLLSILSLVIFFFFLMIRRPPRSTLFPTRRSSDLHSSSSRWNGALEEAGLVERQLLRRAQARGRPHRLVEKRPRDRSEEHTSELQSRLHLVCRLLLEKKKKEEAHDDSSSRITRNML